MTHRPILSSALTCAAMLVAVPAVLAQAGSTEEDVDAAFADLVGPTSPGCAVSIMKDGSPVYERGYGMANLEYGIPITPHSVFHVASVSKHFTAMAIELLVNEGKVDWDDDIRDYVPEVPDFGTPITLRHLVHHVSGIRDQWNLLSMAGWRWEADVVTQGDVLDITARQTALNFRPGERYLYSNTGFTLLAVVVERVTGRTLREFTTERIFEPLGMEATHFHDDHQMLVRNRAYAYGPDDDGEFGLKNSIPDFDVVGATSLFTTAHEMAAWDRNFYTGQVGGVEAFERMRQPFGLNDGGQTDYGHGLSVGRYRGLRTEGHGGADAGYRSNFLRFPDQRLSVAVLCNFPAANPGRRAQRVAEAYLGDVMDPEQEEDDEASSVSDPTVPMPMAQLEALTGFYRGDQPNQFFRAALEDGELKMYQGNDPRTLRPLGEQRFEVVGEGFVARFVESADGGGAFDFPGGRAERLSGIWEPGAEALRVFAGRYHSAELDTEYDVVFEDGALQVRHRKLATRPLTPAYEDAFLLRGAVVEFTRGEGGRVAGFTLSDGRVWGVRFERMGG
ncbi:MAG: beta-lactamase family protein [Gemmatimonadetes bacterium]|nr:beta-lactamase family protein [Gemmatimonadota bacterium]